MDRNRTAVVAALAAAVVSAAGCSSEARTASVQPPASGAYLGAYAQFGEAEDEVTAARIDAFEASAGQHLAWVRFSSYWGKRRFPTEEVKLIASRGSLPDIHWAPWPHFDESRSFGRYKLQRIIDGDWDGYMRRWLTAAAATGVPMLVEFGVEMNGFWFKDWSGLQNGGGHRRGFGDPRKPDGPERYATAYRRIVRIARRVGAGNVSFGFHVNGESLPEARWNRFANYYPGDRYIDWIGMSAYGAQTCKEEWESAAAVLHAAYRELAAVSQMKPMYVGEGGVAECPELGSKPAWIRGFFEEIASRLERIKAVNYWSERWENDDGSVSNLRIDSSPETLDAFRAAIAHPYWRHQFP